MSRNIISDGYTRRFYIEAVEGLHEELSGEYRPMLPEEVETLNVAIDSAKPKESVHLVAAAMFGKLVSWSEVEGEPGKEKPVTLSFEAIRRLPYPLLSRLRRIVAGTSPTDLRPNATPEETNDYLKGLQAAAAGIAPGLEQLANDQKN